jgi:hypothetical protein
LTDLDCYYFARTYDLYVLGVASRLRLDSGAGRTLHGLIRSGFKIHLSRKRKVINAQAMWKKV